MSTQSEYHVILEFDKSFNIEPLKQILNEFAYRQTSSFIIPFVNSWNTNIFSTAKLEYGDSHWLGYTVAMIGSYLELAVIPSHITPELIKTPKPEVLELANSVWRSFLSGCQVNQTKQQLCLFYYAAYTEIDIFQKLESIYRGKIKLIY